MSCGSGRDTNRSEFENEEAENVHDSRCAPKNVHDPRGVPKTNVARDGRVLAARIYPLQATGSMSLRQNFAGTLFALEQFRVCKIERHHEHENRHGKDERVYGVIVVKNDQPDNRSDSDIDKVT